MTKNYAKYHIEIKRIRVLGRGAFYEIKKERRGKLYKYLKK